MITGYTYEDNDKSGSKKIYGINGVGYASSSVPIQAELVFILFE